MNSPFFAALSSTVMLCIFIISGYILRKKQIIPDNSSSVVSSLLLHFFVPILMIDVITRYLTLDNLKTGYPVLLLSLAVIAGSYALAVPIAGKLTKDVPRRNVFIFAMVFSNFGFMGYPVVEAVYGKVHFQLLTLFTIPLYVTVNILGEFMMLEGQKRLNAKSLLTPINISVVIGFLIVFLRIPVSEFFSYWLDMIYKTITPLSMLLAGIVLGSKPLKQMFSNPQIYLVSAIRLIAAPLLLMGILYLFGCRGAFLGIPVLITAMPVAVNGVMLAESLGGDSFAAAQSAFISTFLSILTVSVLSMFIA